MSSLVEVDQYGLAVPDSGGPPIDQSESRRETNLLQLAWRSRWIVLLCMLVGGGIGFAMLKRVIPRYTSESRVVVDQGVRQILSNQMQYAESYSYLYKQAELIRSTRVLAAVADAPANANLESFRGVDNRVGFLKGCIQVAVGSQDEIIRVFAQLPNKEDAAQLVNSVVDAYITTYGDQWRSNTTEVLRILQEEKTHLDDELENLRRERDDFRAKHPALAVTVANENVITQRFSNVAQNLNATEIARLEAKARFERAQVMYDTPSRRMSLLEAASKDQQVMRDMDVEKSVQELEQVLNNELAHWGEGHPRVQQFRKSLGEQRQRLKDQQQAIIKAHVDALQQEYEILDHNYNELRAEYQNQYKAATEAGKQAMQLQSLEEALRHRQEFSDILETRIKEVNLEEEAGAMNVTIMEVAVPAGGASYPVRSRFLGTGVLLGGLLGFGLAWLRDLLDHRLKSVEEIADVLQLPVLGAMPFFGDRHEAGQAGRIVAISPRSIAAESVRTLRTALHFGLAARDVKIIVVTSPSPGDGKSTVTSNLAIAMAQADQRVLLVDADLRKPTQHSIFEISTTRGLASVLTDRRPVEEAIIPNVAEGLDLLPCGALPNNPVELLNNGFFADLLNKLRDKYDRIIIDSPPVMPVADARVIAALGDATLLVLRAERSTRRIALAARNELWRVRATRIGVVVNGVPTRKQGHYGGYGSGYGYGEYGYVTYGGYGHNEEETGRGKRKALLTSQPVDVAVASGGNS